MGFRDLKYQTHLVKEGNSVFLLVKENALFLFDGFTRSNLAPSFLLCNENLYTGWGGAFLGTDYRYLELVNDSGDPPTSKKEVAKDLRVFNAIRMLFDEPTVETLFYPAIADYEVLA